ncbi:MAG: hypothetical protein D6731_02145 [Planctomycetota bacterium]|nr:MAG: hypothetical protein D6731_02145 [Planctomycetota bacterium]
MERAVPVSTDHSTLAVFDSEALERRVRGPGDWWRLDDLRDVQEVLEGTLALFPLGREGNYRVLLRAGSLRPEEERLSVGSQAGLGVRVVSGRVFAGAPERLPGEGRGGPLRHIPGTGTLVEVPPGCYGVTAHVLAWREDSAWYDEDGEPRPDAPPDFLFLLSPRDPTTHLPLAEPLRPLLEFLPRREAKGRAKVVAPPRRRRPAPSPRVPRGGRTRTEQRSRGPTVAAPPPHVPEERAPYDPSRVAAAFREVLYGDLLHPPAAPMPRALLLRPRDPTLLAHDLEGESLLKKATRVREQLRVLEAKVNAHPRLAPWERVELQAPITRVYERLSELVEWLSANAAPRD